MTDFQAFLQQTQQNLATLKEREAKYGGNAPVELLNQIEDHQQAIALTEQAIQGELSLAEWKEALEPPIPDTPGLGLTLDIEAVAKYTRGEAWLP